MIVREESKAASYHVRTYVRVAPKCDDDADDDGDNAMQCGDANYEMRRISIMMVGIVNGRKDHDMG